MPATSIGTPRTVYYVSAAAADDSQNGTTPTTPKKTIGAAKTLADAGSLIIVGAGTYNERDLFKDGIEYHFELGAKVVYSGTAGGIFDDAAGAGVCIVQGQGQFSHTGASGSKEILKLANASTVIFEAISWESTGVGFAGIAGKAYINLQWASTTDGTFDVQNANAFAEVNCGYAFSAGFVAEMDGGYLKLKARRIESSGGNPVEIANAGTLVIEGAEIVAPSGDPCANAAEGRLILVDCTFSCDTDFVAGTAATTVISLGSNLKDSDVVGLVAPIKRLNFTTADTLSVDAISSIIATGVIGVAVPDQPVSLTNNLSVHEGETIQQSVTLLQSDNETPLDLSGLTLELVFSTKDGDFIAVIEHDDITVSGGDNNVITFTYPSSLTSFVGQYLWSLREATAENKLRVKGYVNVLRAATNIS